MTIAKSPEAFKRAAPQILANFEGEVTSVCQAMLLELVQQIQEFEQRVKRAEGWIKAFMKRSALCKRISAIDGVDPVTTTAMVSLGIKPQIY